MTEINKVESDRWKNQSKYDFELAEKLIDTEFSYSCFMFQQAAEKAIVSYLVLKGTDKVWGSSISDLAEDCIAIDPTFDFLKSLVDYREKKYQKLKVLSDLIAIHLH